MLLWNKQLAKIYKPNIVKFALNIWPPFWGAGIKIAHISSDFRVVKTVLKLRWWNKNANRTQYGGSIFSLTDLVYSLMLMGILGERYYVWDKEASINPHQTWSVRSVCRLWNKPRSAWWDLPSDSTWWEVFSLNLLSMSKISRVMWFRNSAYALCQKEATIQRWWRSTRSRVLI